MATEHGGNTNLPRGTGLLASVVGSVARLLGGGGRDVGAERTRADTRDDAAADRLLTPEEYILDAVERSGGSMKQSAIVDSVEWSESTVSRKLSDLESCEAVSRYQVGREKLVYLSGHEPAAVESPLPPAGAD